MIENVTYEILANVDSSVKELPQKSRGVAMRCIAKTLVKQCLEMYPKARHDQIIFEIIREAHPALASRVWEAL